MECKRAYLPPEIEEGVVGLLSASPGVSARMPSKSIDSGDCAARCESGSSRKEQLSRGVCRDTPERGVMLPETDWMRVVSSWRWKRQKASSSSLDTYPSAWS